MGIALEFRAGAPVYSRRLDDLKVEVYYGERGYDVFVVGEELASFLGTAESFDDCLEEIEALQRLVNSDVYRREVARHC